MKLKNRRSESTNTFAKIEAILRAHDAKRVSFDYEGGKAISLMFGISLGGKLIAFTLPARVKNVAKVLYGRPYSECVPFQQEQAYRTAWANIRDWIDSQMALIDTEMVKIEEVFLPYMTDSQGKTFYEHMVQANYQLPSGQPEEGNIL